MPLITGTVAVDLKGLGKFQRTVAGDLRNRSRGPIRDAVTQWGARYRGFAQARFAKFSRGGGSWPSFAPSTRRKRGSMSAARLLRDTGLMFAALESRFSAKPGALNKDIPFGVRVGYGGPGSYPNGASIADVALFHQLGVGFLPARETIVSPDAATIASMRGDMERALLKQGQKLVTD